MKNVVSHGRLKKLNVDIVVGKDCTYFVFGFSKNFVAPSYLLLLAWTTRLRNAFCLLHALKATQPALPHARREIKVGRLVSEDFTTSPRTFLKKGAGLCLFRLYFLSFAWRLPLRGTTPCSRNKN